ncbi:MAG: hypothetical protein E1N59_809 [Puniceicoccaceae bacterium 5H]|nr:MAG: hypothetical protein E1N59_809 [Puniceicoccaceae bacterium 5H]
MIGISSRAAYYALISLLRLGAVGLVLFGLGMLGYELFDEDPPKVSLQPAVQASQTLAEATPKLPSMTADVKLAPEASRLFSGPAGKHQPR